MDDCVAVGLFRHGLTDANQNRQFCGWTDVSVNGEGIAALRQLSVPDYDWIVASDLTRCVQTANVFWPQTHTKSEKLREFHFGEWEKKAHAELEQLPEYIAWLHDYSLQVPGGDSYASFAKRVEEGFRDVLKTMADQNIRRAAIVTHGGVIRHLLSVWAPEAKSFGDWSSENGHGYELSGSLSALRRGERCTSLQAVPSMAKKNG
ncbi:histidine phosphatase family protein [Domibacillus sp. A3M-37]|uniref:histidine phosphatase family protein n=2 Tax=Domibacillus TaxID=1433999 RepID=UPI0020B6860F|nr:histidine phosphatase family protein [Domibacillus sp. A3M-37]MCP3762206.1 histidine phosphatase family protein [Domibacillus sp. A3M-37]